MISMNNNEQLKFMFLNKETSEVVNPQSVTFNIDGSFDKLKGFTNTGVTAEYDVQNDLICLSNYIFVPNIGKIYEGDKIRLKEDSTEEYTLGFGWYTTNEGLDLYGWYLYAPDVIKPFYKSYINTLTVAKFTFNK